MDIQTISLLSAVSHALSEADAAKEVAVDARRRLSSRKTQIQAIAANALEKYPLL